MFCPNCGTKNDDSAQKCSQCGFDQKPKGAAAPKHKGTVMMPGSPVAGLGADKPKSAVNLKGTMVGIAPPDLSGALPGAAKPAASPAAVKSPPASPAAVKSPPANLKGTMIGLAPPNMGAEVEAAKAKMAAKKAQAAEAKPDIAQPKPVAEVTKAPPTQLKGTMIGVAPPDVQVSAAKAKAVAPIQENDPPSEPDPLGGTVVRTSPFAPSSPHAQDNPAEGGLDFNDDTPPAGSRAPGATPEAVMETSRLAAELAATPAGFAPAPIAPSAPEPSPPFSSYSEPVPLPVSKSSMGPVLIVVLLLLIVAVGVGFLVMGKDDAQESTDPDAAGEGATEPAAE